VVQATLRRLMADEAGQALAEYAIVLAFMGGFAHLEYYARDMLANPRKTVLVAAAIGVAVFLFSSRRR